ncbi:ABC transporter permease [Paenibacillus sacheonensis]|uniref:ABC transporter permease subunit n=1 Tax=Paenibacillus sacheonensis TaxID=742054 RepID=A0A7X4YLR5_9BACL|nr:ABC transporter permease [Paenibacillus sacheonensis]MBM7566056.1 peptide/nickel transport system permease protein [Paenibacillus sacheonensis]NBC68635.1 ABC transporter permease subunit [Paenibacillus sacheonensis]
MSGLTTVINQLRRPRTRRKKKTDQPSMEVASQWQLMWWKFKKHKLAVISAVVLILMYLIALFSEFVSPNLSATRFTAYKNAPPQKIHFVDAESGFQLRPFVYGMKEKIDEETFLRTFSEDKTKKYPIQFFAKGEPYKLWGVIPSSIHLFGVNNPDGALFLMGTDQLGHDLFSRIIYGGRISLSFGLVGIVLTLFIGLLLGGVSGYLGGVSDTIIQRIIDFLICIPTIPLWMALSAAVPREWSATQMYFGLIIIFSIIGWTGLARVVRGKILSLREEDFTMAARLAGAGDLRIIRKHLLPSFASYIIVNVTLSIPATILGETSLSFLGIGLQAPAVSWGVLLQDAQNLETLAHHPWLLWPAAFIMLTVLMFNFLGDGLRDAADPYK